MIKLDRIDRILDGLDKKVPEDSSWREGMNIDRRKVNAKRTIDY
jgi:hypothetical protein